MRSLINPGRVYDLEQTVGIENLGSEAEKLGEVIRVMHKFCICFPVLRSPENAKSFGEVVHSDFSLLLLFLLALMQSCRQTSHPIVI